MIVTYTESFHKQGNASLTSLKVESQAFETTHETTHGEWYKAASW